MNIRRKIKPLFLLLASLGTGCALWDDSNSKKAAPAGLIATPASYYSTAKARYLGTKYKDNLDRLAERIVRNSNTSQLQFANNISSVGGIGFFTHSATKTADERYLEVVLSTPETFDSKGEYSEKVNRLFSRFGSDLLAILAGDTQIYQDNELSGYGLNLTWRNVTPELPANRVAMARAIIYLNKERVSRFLRKEVGQNELLRDAVIFAMEEDGPLNLVSYQSRETKPDFRPAIREDNLVAGAVESKPSRLPASSQPAKEAKPVIEAKKETAPKELSAAADTKAHPASVKPMAATGKPGTKASPPAAKNELPPVPRFPESTKAAAQLSPTEIEAETEELTAEPKDIPSLADAQPPAFTLPKPSFSTARSTSSGTNQPDKSKTRDFVPATASSVRAPFEPQPPAKPAEVQKTQSDDRGLVKETAKSAPTVVVSKSLAEKAKVSDEIKTQGAVPVPAAKPLAAIKEKSLAPTSSVTKLASSEPAREPLQAPAILASKEAEPPAKLSERKTEEVARSHADALSPLPIAKAAPSRQAEPADPAAVAVKEAESLEMKAGPIAPPIVASAKAPAPVVKTLPPEPKKELQAKSPAVSALGPSTEKASPAGTATPSTVVEIPAVRPATEKSPEIAVARKVEATAPPLAKLPQTHSTQPSEPALVRKSETPGPALGVAKIEPAQAPKPETKRPIAAPVPEIVKERPEQLALLRKPAEPAVEKLPLSRPVLKSLEGFIIQIAFSDKAKAQNWAEKMQQRGYAVSVTEAGAEGSLRVRLGNFAVRDDAERQLRNFKQDGMSGIIINLPQAFQPEARSSVP